MADLLVLTLGGVAGGLAVACVAGAVWLALGHLATRQPDAVPLLSWWQQQEQEPRCPHCGRVTYSLELHPRRDREEREGAPG